MSQRILDWKTDVLTTTDATPTASASAVLVIPSGASGHVEVEVNARIAGTTAGGSAKVVRTFQNVAGTLALTGALVTIFGTAGALIGDATITTALVSVVTSGTTVKVQVTGIVATSIEWLISSRWALN